MQRFFDKTVVSSSCAEENEYEFEPIAHNPSDEETHSLFEQLEEGARYGTDIHGTIKSGANLYAKKTKGHYIGCYPIHVAAYNVGGNTGAVSSILQAFDDPEERKKYIFLRSNGKNVLEVLLGDASELDQDIAIPSILSIFSYLTPREQQELVGSLSKKAKRILERDETGISRQGDIGDFATLNYFLKSGKTIDMCRQRREEAERAFADYDSDEESLGKLDSVYNRKFTAKVSYRDIRENGVVINSIPELMLIPSDWRLETAVHHNQGDHVTAYVLLLSSFSHCEGENVKKLPELIYNLAISALPDSQKVFQKAKQKNDRALDEHRTRRVETIASLRAHSDKEETFIRAVENDLKKAEIELIARHIENTIDKFIKMINKLEDESFSQKRKQSLTKSYILQQFILVLEKRSFLNEKKYSQFKSLLVQAIQHEAGIIDPQDTGVTDRVLDKIAASVVENKFTAKQIPKQLLSKTGKLTKQNLLGFLKDNTPFKKYHEGHVIEEIKKVILTLQQTANRAKRNILLANIGFLCFKLFDYPRVNDARYNDENVLYQAIPRHWIIINAAFSYLKGLTVEEKKIIYDAFLNNILVLQGWANHPVEVEENVIGPLSLNLLKENVLTFAKLDKHHDFSIKPKILADEIPEESLQQLSL